MHTSEALTETRVFEYLAVSILEALPDEKLPALDAALNEGGDAVDIFLAEHVHTFDQVLREALHDLRIIISAANV